MGVEGSLWQEKEKSFTLTRRQSGPSAISGEAPEKYTATPAVLFIWV